MNISSLLSENLSSDSNTSDEIEIGHISIVTESKVPRFLQNQQQQEENIARSLLLVDEALILSGRIA